MNRALFRPYIRLLIKVYRWVATIYGAAYVGLKVNWDPVKAALLPTMFSDTWEFVAVWGWSVAAFFVVTNAPSIWLSKKIQPEQIERILKAVLTNYRKKAMPSDANENSFRVTLYKYRGFSCLQLFRWMGFGSSHHPWSGWLCPYLRPGFCRTGSSARWHATLQKIGQSEGVAGMAYESEEPLVIQNLPALEEIKRSDKKLRQYLKETRTPVKWLRKKAAKEGDLFPRSFYGARVLIDGAPWGVLLFDSEHPTFPDPQGLNIETVEIVKILNAVLTSRL